MTNIELSKFLSYVLRHKPESIGITLYKEGWVYVSDLIALSEAAGKKFELPQLYDVVETSDKKRFTMSDDGMLIRAAQGHTTDSVEMTFTEKIPPTMLFHGTAEKNIASIRKEGLIPGKRHHVHLSTDVLTATTVGKRHGKVVVLVVDTKKMVEQGIKFYVSDNGVWLTDKVAPEFITF